MARAKKAVHRTSSQAQKKTGRKTPVVSVVPAQTTRLRLPSIKQIGAVLAHPFVQLYHRLRDAREASPHKTFVLTRSRDMPVGPFLKKSWRFTLDVFGVLWRHKRVFAALIVLYVVMAVLLTGAIKGEGMTFINEAVQIFNEESDFSLDPVLRSAVVAGAALGGALNTGLTEIEQLYMTILYVFTCLVSIWLIRHLAAGNAVKLRDGLYNAGAPFVAILCLLLLLVVQSFPAALGILALNVLTAGGVLQGGIETAMFWIAIGLLFVLTLYFVSATLFAFVIATVPGTYPWAAYKLAKKIVLGQRRRLLFRLLWLAFVIAATWMLVLIPVVLVINALKLENTLLIPVLAQVMTGFSFVLGSTYVYMLYRRMIDEPAQ